MKKDLKKIIIEKGQGLTEYVLILAFVAGLAFMMFGGNGSLKGTLDNTLTETVRILAGLFGEKTDWAHVNRKTFTSDSSAERLAVDQKALENFATFFIGKTKAEVKALLNGVPQKFNDDNTPATNDKGKPIREDGYEWKGENDGTNYTDLVLGWVVNTEEGTHFITKDLRSDGNSTYTFGTGDSAYSKNYNDEALNWMLGDYATNGSYTQSYDPARNYLVSDYANTNFDNSKLTYDKDPSVGGNGVKLSLRYENGVVTGARVAVDPGSQTKNPSSQGLDVKVLKNQSTGKLETTLMSGYKNNNRTF